MWISYPKILTAYRYPFVGMLIVAKCKIVAFAHQNPLENGCQNYHVAQNVCHHSTYGMNGSIYISYNNIITACLYLFSGMVVPSKIQIGCGPVQLGWENHGKTTPILLTYSNHPNPFPNDLVCTSDVKIPTANRYPSSEMVVAIKSKIYALGYPKSPGKCPPNPLLLLNRTTILPIHKLTI
jgi:hypothetical protein